MAIPELLVATSFQATLQVGELVGGTTFNQIGPNVPVTGTDLLNVNTKHVVNRVIEYKGSLYAVFRSTGQTAVYTYSGGTWNVIPGTQAGADFPTAGLYVFNTGTTQRLIYWFQHNSINIRGYWTDDGANWNFFATVGGNYIGSGISVEFNNKLFLLYTNLAKVVVQLDPISLSAASAALPVPGAGGVGDFCVFDDRLFLLTTDGTMASSSDWVLLEFVAGSWILNTQITNDSRLANATGDNGACCLFKDPNANKLIAVCNGQGVGAAQYGSTAFELIPSGGTFTVNDITAIIPAGFGPGARGANVNFASDRWYKYVSNDVPGAAEVFLFFAAGPAPGTSYSIYTYVDSTTQLSSPAAGPSTVFSIPNTMVGGGERINRGVGNQCVIESTTPIVGGMQVSYRVYGTQTGQRVRLYFSEDQTAPTTQAVLAGVATGGGTRVGNEIQGVNGDDGATVRTLVMDVAGSGLANGDTITLALDIRL